MPAQCQKQAEITVSVKDRIGFIARNYLKVQDELETLARNQAYDAKTNAIQPIGTPIEGKQRYSAFRCSL